MNMYVQMQNKMLNFTPVKILHVQEIQLHLCVLVFKNIYIINMENINNKCAVVTYF